MPAKTYKGWSEGRVVMARERLDPEGANVKRGTWGVVLELYYSDGKRKPCTGALVGWTHGGVCDVSEYQVALVKLG